MRVTAFEESTLDIRAYADEATSCLDIAMAESLFDLSDRMGARFISWNGRDSVRLHQFVGTLRVCDFRLELLPKLDALPAPADVRRNLLAMLAETRDLRIHPSELVGFLENSEPFVSALARLYCHRLLDALRRGLRQEYMLHTDRLPHIRGKVDWSTYVKQHGNQRLEFPCLFDERSEDTPLNRVLKAALLQASLMLENPRSTNTVTELRHVLSSVSDTVPSSEVLARVRTDRMSRHLEPLLGLANLILGHRNPDQAAPVRGTHGTYALVWDMNVLFEEYVGRVTSKVQERKGWRVSLQADAKYLALDTQSGKAAFLLKPDILFYAGAKPLGIADTKWKWLDGKAPHLGVSESDVYQMVAYARRYAVSEALLIYPHHPALGAPGLKREYLIENAPRLSIVTVDLASLDTVPGALEQIFSRLRISAREFDARAQVQELR